MKSTLLLLTLFLSTFTNAWTIDKVGQYQFEPIAKNVFVIHGPVGTPSVDNQGFMNNPAIIIGKTGVIVIDPGSAYHIGKKVITEIEKITKKPIIAVFNTHAHGDHWLGNQAVVEHYPSVKIYAHAQMLKQAHEGEADFWLNIMNDNTQGYTKETKAVYPTDSVAHLQKITLDSEQFIIHSPTQKAHTDTDIMIEHVSSQTLFLGDNAIIDFLGSFDASSDMHSNITALNYAVNLKLKNYVPGHGQTGSPEIAINSFLDYLAIVKQQAENGYEEDLSDYEIKPTALKKLHAYKHWAAFDEQIGKHIGKMLQEVEALDF
ncbi:MAG: MBL fold metallo-hydrolase [Candidatus Thioglobus sp.]|jgi:glyoxylase-like metal-dependent hydrolase (beta-lactamase superfamily II)|nr:MBL fold metallo-hydrolase [Candidatus Thioglobus sp.]